MRRFFFNENKAPPSYVFAASIIMLVYHVKPTHQEL